MLILIEGEPGSGKTTVFKDIVEEDKLLVIDLETKKAPKFIRANTTYYRPETPEEVLRAIIKGSKSDKYDFILVEGLSRYADFLQRYFKKIGVSKYQIKEEYSTHFNELVKIANSVNKIVIGINHEFYDSKTLKLKSVAKGEFAETGGYMSHVNFVFRVREIDGQSQLLTDPSVSRVPFDFETDVKSIFPFKKKDEQDHTIIDLLRDVEEYYKD